MDFLEEVQERRVVGFGMCEGVQRGAAAEDVDALGEGVGAMGGG